MHLARRRRFRNFYAGDPADQRREALGNLLRYLREYVRPFHPFLRKRYADIDLSRIRTYEDFTSLPIVTKADYRADPRAFILQPKFPTREHVVPYDTAPIPRGTLRRYAWQALWNRPYDYAPLFRALPFREGKIGRRAALEWFPVHFQGSTGTTGDPTPVAYTHYELDNNLRELSAAMFLEPRSLDPSRPRITWTTRHMSLFPGVPHLAFYQGVLTKVLGGVSLFDTCGGKVIPTDKQIELFANGKFETLGGVPSYILHWLRRAAELQRAGRIPALDSLFGAICGAEPLPPGMREAIRAQARDVGAHPKFTILEAYGMTEMKWAFTQCDEGTGIHLNPKYWFWEVLDKDTLKPVPEGAPGVLVFSHIDWRGTVFVRYNTGDLIQGGVRWQRCPSCRFTWPILRGPIARAQRDFTKIKGTRVALLDLQNAVRDTRGVRDFQIVLDKEVPGDPASLDYVRLRVVPENGCDRASLSTAVKDAVRNVNGFTPDEVAFEPDAEAFERELFNRTGIKADVIVEKRAIHL